MRTAWIILLRALLVWADEPIRKTIYGDLRGFDVEEDGTKAQVFLGVPYAKPPIEDRRFEVPEKLDPWSPETRNATEPPSWCVQFWYPDPRIEARSQSEDCLYMNIFVPVTTVNNDPKPYPVLFWIHGGSYQVNGANMFPTDGTVRNLVSKGMVVVFINYRLGPLGFLSTLNDSLHGNYGLEDQIMALKWVQDNIHFFDGDPNRVTVGGESAGAASVSLLSISPRGKGLFQQAMIRSGSSLAPWAVRSINTDLNSLLMIRWARCYNAITQDIDIVKRCLKAVSVKDLRAIWQAIGNHDLMFVISPQAKSPQNYNHPFLAHTYFTPVVDGFRKNGDSIIPDYPINLIQKNTRIPVMIGVTTGECTAYVTWLYFLVSQDEVDVNLHDLEFVVPRVVYANSEQIKYAVYDEYVNKHLNNRDFDYGKALVQIASDQNFVSPAVSEARHYVQAGLSTYVYIFEHGNDQLRQKHTVYGLYNVGAAHGYDMVYVFQSTSVLDPVGQSLNWTEDDLKMTNFLSDVFANFVKSGSPANVSLPGSLSWPQYSLDCAQALVISLEPKLSDFFSEAYIFWERTVAVVQSLTLTKGYEFYEKPEEETCVQNCDTSEINFYKAAFFVVLLVCVLLLLALLTLCCAYRNNRTSSYTLAALKTGRP